MQNRVSGRCSVPSWKRGALIGFVYREFWAHLVSRQLFKVEGTVTFLMHSNIIERTLSIMDGCVCVDELALVFSIRLIKLILFH